MIQTKNDILSLPIYIPKIDEYNLLRHQVDPLTEPESPPPAPTTTYISGAELSHITQDWNWPSPLQRMVRSVGCDLPQHVAEKFSNERFIYVFHAQQVGKRKKKPIFVVSLLSDGSSRIINMVVRSSEDGWGASVDQRNYILLPVQHTTYIGLRAYHLLSRGY